MAQELKRHHINELIGMIKLKGGIGYPIVYYANEVDAVVSKKDTKIGKLTDELSKTGGQIKRLADLAHAHNIELARKEELKTYDFPVDHGDFTTTIELFYLKSEADKVIAKKDKEIVELKAKLESVQASAYAESVDAGMRERKLKRALWLARAESAKDAEVERKCHAKAEAYK